MPSDQMHPVFVVGCQRSGSTLLGAMLGAHPEIVCVPEGQFIVDLMPPSTQSGVVVPTEIIEEISRHWRFQIWDFDLGSRRPGEDETAGTYRGTIEWLIRQYAATRGRQFASVWVDQQPGHLLHIPALVRHFPEAKFIHIVRDGRAVAASIMPLDWGPNEVYGAARFWQIRVGIGYAAAAFLPPEQLVCVRFEDLLVDPEHAMRKLAEFVGISYVPEMLIGTGLQIPNFTREQHGLVGTPLARDRINAWQKVLSKRQIEVFERLTGGLLELLGYELMFGSEAARLDLTEKILLIGRDQIKKVINSMKLARRRRKHVLTK